MPHSAPDRRPDCQTRLRVLDLVLSEPVPDIAASFSLEWLFDHLEGRRTQEGGRC